MMLELELGMACDKADLKWNMNALRVLCKLERKDRTLFPSLRHPKTVGLLFQLRIHPTNVEGQQYSQMNTFTIPLYKAEAVAPWNALLSHDQEVVGSIPVAA